MNKPHVYTTAKYPYIQSPWHLQAKKSNNPKVSNSDDEPSCIIEDEYCNYFDLGDTAPDFVLNGIIGGKESSVSLSDYRETG